MISLAFVAACMAAQAQVRTPQASPKANIVQTVGLTEVELDYSRPAVKGRTIFGDLVPFGKMWRTGANANSTVLFSEDVEIGGTKVAKGKYAIFTIPKVDSWEVIFYKDTNSWGLPEKFEESKVAARTNVKPVMLNRNVETFSIGINDLHNDGGTIEIAWEKTLVPIPFTVPTQKTALASIEKTLAGPSKQDYFQAAQYYYQSNMEMNKALEYINKATEGNDAPFWMLRQKSLIQAKAGDKKGAIATAKQSLEAAKKANNADYVKLNEDSIKEWSK